MMCSSEAEESEFSLQKMHRTRFTKPPSQILFKYYRHRVCSVELACGIGYFENL